MAKGFKVKRYNRIYRRGTSPASKALRFFSTIVVVGILGFVGWNAYGPVSDFLSRQTQPVFQPNVEASSSSAQEPDVSAPETNEASSEPQQPQQPQESKEQPDGLHGIYLSADLVADAARLDTTLSSLDAARFNAVYFDLKNDDGHVLYRSYVENATLSAEPYDLSAVCTKIKDKGFLAVGRISAFRDPLAASRIKDAGVTYGNSKILWNDDDPAHGGKPWLNPYAAPAQEYVNALAEEAVGMGVSTIVYANVCFPSGYSLHLASYGSVTQSKADELTAFLTLAENRITAAGGSLWTSVSGLDALGAGNSHYGNQNPLSLISGPVLLNVSPAQFGDEYTQDSFSVSEPLLHPGDSVNLLLQAVAPSLTGKATAALVQGYTAAGQFTHNKQYTAQDIEEQVSVLEQNGIENYIVYSPDGNYPDQEAS